MICFISNYSWLDGLSFTGMRERYLEAFDHIRIDCLNGDKYKTGKVAPDGSPDPSIFSTEGDPVGIQVGTAIATLVRKPNHGAAHQIGFRHLWGQGKPTALLESIDAEPSTLYHDIEPILALGLPFARMAASTDWFEWPPLPELFPVSHPGIQTARDSFLVDTDLARLRARVAEYFDTRLNDEAIARRYPTVMKTTGRFDARAVRNALLNRGGPNEPGFIRFSYRPFDTRWVYWEKDTKLLDEKRADYRPHVFDGNLALVAQQKPRREWSPPQVIGHIGCLDLMDRGATCIPVWLHDDGIGNDGSGGRRPNLSPAARRYLDRFGLRAEDLFHHIIATLHDPAYREANAGALRMGWPRIPLPGWPDAEHESAAEQLAQSTARGRELAALLNSDTSVPGVTQGPLRREIALIAVPATISGLNMTGDDFAVSAGWGRYGQGDAVMPGQGRASERAFSAAERTAMGETAPALGETTFDVHLNANALWRNVPAAVWNYKLGGYQVLKKWLSYRENAILGRPLHSEEILHFTDTARRIAAILGRQVADGTAAASAQRP